MLSRCRRYTKKLQNEVLLLSTLVYSKTTEILKTRELTLVETLDNVKCPSKSLNREEVLSNHLIFLDSCANKSFIYQQDPNNNYSKLSSESCVENEDNGFNDARSAFKIAPKFDETYLAKNKSHNILSVSRKNSSDNIQSSNPLSSTRFPEKHPTEIKRSDSFLKRLVASSRENWTGCEKFIRNIHQKSPSGEKKVITQINRKPTEKKDYPVPPIRRKRKKNQSSCNTNSVSSSNPSLSNEQKDNSVSTNNEDTIRNCSTEDGFLLINASYSSHKGDTSSREHLQEFSLGLKDYSTTLLQPYQCIKLIPNNKLLQQENHERQVSSSRSISTDDVDDLIKSNDNFKFYSLKNSHSSTLEEDDSHIYLSSLGSLKSLGKNNRKVKSDLDLSCTSSDGHLNSNLKVKLKRSPSPEDNAFCSGSVESSDNTLRSCDNSLNKLRYLNWSNSAALASSVSSSDYSFTNVSDFDVEKQFNNSNSTSIKRDFENIHENFLVEKGPSDKKSKRKHISNPRFNKQTEAEQRRAINSQETKANSDDYWSGDNFDKKSVYCNSCSGYISSQNDDCSCSCRSLVRRECCSSENYVGLVSESDLTVTEYRNLLSDVSREKNESPIEGKTNKQLTAKKLQQRQYASRPTDTLTDHWKSKSASANKIKKIRIDNNSSNMKIIIKMMRIREKIIYGFSAFAILFTLLLVMDLQMDLGYSGHHLVPSHGRVRIGDEPGRDTVYTNFRRKFLQRVNASKELTASDNSIGGGPNSRDNTANNAGVVGSGASVAAGSVIKDNTKIEPPHDDFGDLVDILINADNIDLETGVVRISNEDYSDNPTIGDIREIPIR